LRKQPPFNLPGFLDHLNSTFLGTAMTFEQKMIVHHRIFCQERIERTEATPRS
jgi:hypothetical protein